MALNQVYIEKIPIEKKKININVIQKNNTSYLIL